MYIRRTAVRANGPSAAYVNALQRNMFYYSIRSSTENSKTFYIWKRKQPWKQVKQNSQTIKKEVVQFKEICREKKINGENKQK